MSGIPDIPENVWNACTKGKVTEAVGRCAAILGTAWLLHKAGNPGRGAPATKAGSELPALAGGARTIEEAVQPGGQLIGRAGSSTAIREVQGGQTEAEQLFNELSTGGVDVTPTGHPGELVRLPNGGHIGYRAASKSGPPTIDINVPGIAVRKIKFIP